MKTLIISLGLLFFGVLSFSQNHDDTGFDCYTIAVGKDVSTTGNVLIGHNEDDWGEMVINLYKVEPKKHKSGEMIKLVGGELIPQVDYTYGYLWWQTTTEKFGDYVINEKGVSICSDACLSREDTASGIIGFYLRRLVAERADCAKNGVLIAGRLIEEYGYETSGRTYIIADKNETWLMSVVQGKRWIAQRVPDNEIAIIPNYYTIQEVDLKDTENFLSSPDIISYAALRGWYDQSSGEEFNFRNIYGDKGTNYSMGNIARHWSGISQLDDRAYSYGENFPFSFVPGRKITKDDIMKVLSSHYEGTDFETNYNLHTAPHENMVHRICNHGTKYSFVTEFYSGKDQIDYCVWWAPMSPCIHPYIPIVNDIDEIPVAYQNRPLSEAFDMHFDKDSNQNEKNPQSAYSVFYSLNSKIEEDYHANIKLVESWKDDFEEQIEGKFYKSLNDKKALKKMSELYLNKIISEEKLILNKR